MAGLLAMGMAACAADLSAIPAFPGAEGFGAYARGGRGGKVLYVTTLDDEGSGSLRWAVDQDGPRTVIFDISGTIRLRKELVIRRPFITIAGQTAPGDGICLRDASLVIATHDVIVRYLRCRLGDQGRGGDAISITEGKDIILDHCSASWSTDEVLSVSTREPRLTNVTVQWCFITEALNPKGHGFGSLIRGTGGARYSFLHNLYAHNRGRNPRPGNYDSNPYEKDPDGLLLDFRNNVIYNWQGRYAGYNADRRSVTRLNYVGNYLVPGPDSQANGIAYATGSPYNRAFFAGNVYDGRLPADPWCIVRYDPNWTDQVIEAYKQDRPFEAGLVHDEDAFTAYQQVLKTGGASLPRRDSVDRRVVNDVLNRTGRIINSQEDVGGWPQLKSKPAPADSDGDGMPDEWERRFGLNAADPSDGPADQDRDGYTNLEEYLNGTNPTEFVDYTNPSNNIDKLQAPSGALCLQPKTSGQ
jgi:pectate lyase